LYAVPTVQKGVLPLGETVALAENLCHQAVRVRPLDQEGAQVAVQREDPVLGLEFVADPHHDGLLSLARVDASLNLPLPVEGGDAVLELPDEAKPVIEFPLLLLGHGPSAR
jgi:hypothetical protein